MSELDSAALLRAVAAGRREYARGLPEGDPRFAEDREALIAQAITFETAARIVEGDFGPLYDLLPSWRWTEAMHSRVLSDSSSGTTAEDVTGLGVEA